MAIVLTMFIVCLPSDSQGDESDDIIKSVLDAWETRRANAGVYRYTVEGERLITKGRYSRIGSPFGPPPTGDEPPEDYTFDEEFIWTIDFARQLVRTEASSEIYHHDYKLFYPSFTISTFDGTHFKGYSPADRRKTEEYTPWEYDPEFFRSDGDYVITEPYVLPVYFAVGILSDAVDPRTFHEPIDRSRFRFHGTARHKDRTVVVLRRSLAEVEDFEGYEEYWVDVEAHGQIVCWQYGRNERPRYEVMISYSDRTMDAVVSGWVVSHYSNDAGAPQQLLDEQRTLRVTSVEVDPQDVGPDTFRISPPPGTIANLGGERRYRVGEDGKFVELADRDGSMTTPGFLFFFLAGVSMILIIGLVMLLWFKRES